jgi:hypothetical protein
LAILIPSLIFVIAWIVFSILHNIATSTIAEPLNTQIIQIAPSFDANTIAILKKRQNVTPSYQITVPIENVVIPATKSAATPTPTPTVVAQPVSTQSAQPATSGGSLTQ